MSFPGRIRRGPMAADVFERQFTQIFNGALRDSRTSLKAKGLLALIASHREGFGISEESISSCATDKISSVRSGLKELEKFGYLRRRRTRDELGRLGASEYYITDMPDGLALTVDPAWDEDHGAEQPDDQADEPADGADEQESSSQPTCEKLTLDGDGQTPSSQPTCDSPAEDQPRQGKRPHKKTSPSKKTGDQVPPSRSGAHDALGNGGGGREANARAASPRAPRARSGPQPPAAAEVSEQAAKTASAALSAGPPVRADRAAAIAARIDQLLARGVDAAALTAYLTSEMRDVKSIAAVVQHRLEERHLPVTLLPAPGEAVEEREWCGKCDGPRTRQIEIDEPGNLRVIRCPECNPRAAVPAAF
jgi:hypothetical protein